MKKTRSPAVLGVFALALVAGTAAADQTSEGFCRLILAEEQIERDDLALEKTLAGTRRSAAGEVYGLLDALWKKGAVEELIYLRAGHDNDVARLEEERLALLLDRQDAVIEQYRRLCDSLSSGGTGAEDRQAIDRVHALYREKECASRLKQSEIAEADLRYGLAVLDSVRELERSDLATQQEIILAERDVEISRKSLEDLRLRAARCAEASSGRP